MLTIGSAQAAFAGPSTGYESDMVATVAADLSIYADEDENSEVVAMAEKGESYDVVGKADDSWIKVAAGEMEGYLKVQSSVMLSKAEEAAAVADAFVAEQSNLSTREQLVKAIDNISLAAYTGNVIITGEEGMDTLSLAKNMVREIQATDSNFSGKVAKISGHALNKKDTADTLSKLKNGALIICKASEMNDATANVLHKALQQESQGIVIILEDTKRDIDKFLEKHEKLRECFTARMDVEALSNNTLVAFGKQYAREMEYSIDELGELALHTRIEDMQTIDHVVTVVDVKQIVDEAIAHANKKTLKHFFDVLFAKRYDDEDMIILTEKDFV